jgi:probable rRNA maturation factor
MITEMALYAIHGLLHLCGYDDHNDVDRRKMRQRERHYLQLLGFPDVTDTE